MEPDKLEEVVTGLRIGQAEQTIQIAVLDKKVDEIKECVDEIKESMTKDVKAQNSRYKVWIIRAVMVILSSGAMAGGAQALLAVFK